MNRYTLIPIHGGEKGRGSGDLSLSWLNGIGLECLDKAIEEVTDGNTEKIYKGT